MPRKYTMDGYKAELEKMQKQGRRLQLFQMIVFGAGAAVTFFAPFVAAYTHHTRPGVGEVIFMTLLSLAQVGLVFWVRTVKLL